MGWIMKNYIYLVQHSSKQKGFNRTVIVYQLKNNKPCYIGTNDRISTAAYKGDYAIACEIISNVDGHKMDKTGYELLSKSIKLWSV